MKKICLSLIVAVAAAGLVWARQEKGGQEGHQAPKLSKEHEGLKDMEGTWDYVMKFKPGPDQPEMESKGTEVCSMVGGYWLVFDNKSPDFMGQAWHGHGSIGYDTEKKKYIGTFINSLSPYLMVAEGTSDGPNRMTMNWEGKHGPSDTVEKTRSVHEKKDKDHSVMTMYGPGPDGKEMTYFTITYTRKGAK
ncbi:MAG TPA: DUF1579 domain-containing protein [Planctomycetota bacterium]|nr:DUF1579 domain-containing protein [Planctomycetota bacterium]